MRGANVGMFVARCGEEGAAEVRGGQSREILHPGLLRCLPLCQVRAVSDLHQSGIC